MSQVGLGSSQGKSPGISGKPHHELAERLSDKEDQDESG